MNRLNGTEDGYSFRGDQTKKIIDAKASMRSFIDRMNEHEFDIPASEMNLLANADAALDELLHVYHKLVLVVDDD